MLQLILGYDTQSPDLSAHCFIADSSDVVGRVLIEEDSSVWFQATVRGDFDEVKIGARTCIQEQSAIHVSSGFPVNIGNDVIVEPGCLIRGCRIGDGALIGTGSILMSGCTVGKGAVIGAGSLITESMNIPDGMVAYGRPAKVIRKVTDEEREQLEILVKKYVELSKLYIK